MTHDHTHHGSHEGSRGSFWTSRAFFVFLGFAAIAVVLLWQEHSAHLLGALPYLFLLACPLMHVFMHGGHGGHSGHGGPQDQGRADQQGATGNWNSTKGDKS